ncbi:hypothetical protein ACM66B_006139 [Microbotryomycetes sp. NB124-2]
MKVDDRRSLLSTLALACLISQLGLVVAQPTLAVAGRQTKRQQQQQRRDVDESRQPLSQQQPHEAEIKIPLVKRQSAELTNEDGSVRWDRLQAHLAKANVKFVRGTEAYLQNSGQPLLGGISGSDFAGMFDTAEALGRRAWDTPDQGSLDWAGDSFANEFGDTLRRRGPDEEDEATDKVFDGGKGFKGVPHLATGQAETGDGELEKRANNPKFESTQQTSKAAIPCVKTSQCSSMKVPDNSHPYCNPSLKQCTYLCDSGYTLNPWSKTCQKNKGKSSASRAATTSAAAAKSSTLITPAAQRSSTVNAAQASASAASRYSAELAKSSSAAAAAAASKSAAAAAAAASPKSGSNSLTNYNNDMLWAGALSIGTPAKTFLIDFDTGSADLWVPSAACTSDACAPHNKYDSTSSSTSQLVPNSKLSISYGDGSSTTGSVYTDTVALAGLVAENQTFGAATGLSSDWKDDPMDGLMGMGYQSISQLQRSPMFQTLVSQGKVSAPQFSFKLGETGSSELFLGGMNPSLFVSGSTQWVSVVSQSYWIVPATAYANDVAAASNFNAIIDSGTSVIVAPSLAAKRFWAQVPNSAVYGQGYYTYECKSPPSISFSFGGANSKKWSISGQDLNLGKVSSGSSRCVGAVVGADVGVNAWILGDTFFKGAYITFDLGQNRVGFSELA